MPTFTVTPYARSDASLRDRDAIDVAMIFPRADRHVVLPMAEYDEREPLECGAVDAHQALETAWVRFQNVDHAMLTPDGGRSLMTGDMAKVDDGRGSVGWWICCSMGWAETMEPGAEAVRVGDGTGSGAET